jgi:hypothetical protein
MTHISKSDVMREAWSIFHDTRRRYEAWQLVNREDGTFSGCLRQAWRVVKAAVERVKRDELLASNAQARAIQQAIDDLSLKSFRYDISAERRELETKLAALGAA